MGTRPLLCLLLAMLWLSGCDHVREGGSYRIKSGIPSELGKPRETQNLKPGDVVRNWLRDQGFSQFRPMSSTWLKRGVRVNLLDESDAGITVAFGAMGSKRDLRLSEKVERLFRTFLETHPEVEATVMPNRQP